MKKHFTLALMLLHGLAFSQLKQISGYNFQPGASNPGHFSLVNGEIYMHANDGRSGWEIWKTNGTTGGTTLVSDLNLGSKSSVIETSSAGNDLQFKNKLYFLADDGIRGRQIWSTNGTSTERITDDLGVVVSGMAASTDHFYFLTSISPNGLKLWKCDGSKGGVTLVTNIITSSISNYIDNMHNIREAMGLIFFSVADFNQPSAVWRTDGTAAGTFPVAEALQGISHMTVTEKNYATQFVEFEDHLYFIARSPQFGGQVGLVKTDGTVQGTEYIKTMFGQTGDGLEFWDVIVHDGKMYFSFFDEEINRNFIWTSGGTSGTTNQIYSYSAAEYFSPSVLCSSGSSLYFTSGFSEGGTALLQYNESSSVQILKQLTTSNQRPTYFSRLLNFVKLEAGNPNVVYVNVIQSIGDLSSLWVSNGTPDATMKLSESHKLGGMLFKDGNLYYSGAVGSEWELWKTDGTPSGTGLVKDINVAYKGIYMGQSAIAIENRIVYGVHTVDNGLWMTDVNGSETKKIADVFPQTQFISVDNGAYFLASSPGQQTGIFFTDGTTNGTVPVSESSEFQGSPNNLYKVNNNKFFIRTLSNQGNNELFLFDAGSLTEVKKLYEPGGDIFGFIGATVRNNLLYFTTRNYGPTLPPVSWSLWKSDGTSTGTVRVKDFYNIVSSITNQTGTDRVYFYVKENEGDTDLKIYSSDGTPGGTVVIKTVPTSYQISPNFYAFKNQTVFFIPGAGLMRELWITSGTPESTILLKEVEILQTIGQNIPEIAVLGDELFFCAKKGDTGYELWKTDGTATGTVLVKDINPGAGSSRPSSLTVIGDYLYFSAYTPEHGFEVWNTDGTTENTKLVVDVCPGAAYSNPKNFLSVDGKLVFFARSESSGDQFFTYAPEPEPEEPVTGVEGFFENSLVVYPNPTDGSVRVDDKDIIGGTVNVYDTKGNWLIKNASVEEGTEINISNRPPGLYLLKFQKAGKITTVKIIKH